MFYLIHVVGHMALFMGMCLALDYFMRRDVTVDRLIITAVLGLIPGGFVFFWLFVLAAFVLNGYLINHTLVSRDIVFAWSKRK